MHETGLVYRPDGRGRGRRGRSNELSNDGGASTLSIRPSDRPTDRPTRRDGQRFVSGE